MPGSGSWRSSTRRSRRRPRERSETAGYRRARRGRSRHAGIRVMIIGPFLHCERIWDERSFRRRAPACGPGPGTAAAGRGHDQCVLGAARTALRVSRALSVGRRGRKRVVRAARSRHHEPERCLRGRAADRECHTAAAARGCGHRLGRSLQHLADGRRPDPIRCRGLPSRGPGAGQALRAPSGQGSRHRPKRWSTASRPRSTAAPTASSC